ncbi:MAG: DegV family protein [Tindallia sp. MSAO_Bac2]|nr:MAG: DegV family protein [Tindallia sp. MSAO_Bac2]
MRKIKIITDSMTDLPAKLTDQYSIEVIPLTIIFGDQEYRDGFDLSNKAFYEKLKSSEVLPRTSQVTPADFNHTFTKWLDEDFDIICINASSKASGTYQSAVIAANDLNEDRISIVDTLSLSFGAGLSVLKAARMAGQGHQRETIVEALKNSSANMEHIFTVDTVEFLQKGGRINPGKALVANLLNIKPILTLRDGLVDPLDKVRGSKRVMDKMIELAQERGSDFTGKTIGISHADAPDKAEELYMKVKKDLNPSEILISEIGCTIGTHTGPGTLALFFESDTKSHQ